MIIRMKKTNGISRTQLVLTLGYVTFYMVNFILLPETTTLYGMELSLSVYVFPFLYAISDIFSEVWGYRASRSICYLAVWMNILMFGLFKVYKYPTISYKLFIALNLAFILGDYVNDRIFYTMKKNYPNTHKGFATRAILSSFAGELLDNIIFAWIVFGIGHFGEFVRLVSTVTAFRLLAEIVLLPWAYLTSKQVFSEEFEEVGGDLKTYYSYDNKQIRR